MKFFYEKDFNENRTLRTTIKTKKMLLFFVYV